jgi:hypothetical protein
LVDAMADAERGPKRNGLFALWLIARQCDGGLPPDAIAPASARRRLDRLERRLSSLSLPGPLRRSLPGALRELRESHPDGSAIALQQLVAPARETLGVRAAEAMAVATRTARAALRASPTTP